MGTPVLIQKSEGRSKRFIRSLQRLGSRRPLATLPLLVALLLTLRPAPAQAASESSKFVFALIQHGGNFDPRPNGFRRIAWEIAKRTSIEVGLDSKVVRLSDPELFRYPLLVLTGDGDFPPFSEVELEGLRRHLNFGGLLLVDDASGQPGGAFDRAARRELARVLPSATIGRIPSDHVLFKSFYLLNGAYGRTASASPSDGIALQDRLAVIFSPSDLQGAVARDSFGNWEYELSQGGREQREWAVRFGVNIAMYALCLDYKDDQVHIPFIMKRRR